MATAATRVFMVRHGATVVSAEDRFAGESDVALSDEGREQIRQLAERLSNEKISAVYASPLGRTVETAQILAAPHKLEVQTRDGLREISHGRWEQMTRREVEEKYPEEAAEWEKDPYTFAPVGGESGLAVTARAKTSSSFRTRRRFDCCLAPYWGLIRGVTGIISIKSRPR
jgi:broad specificity phosphatase PhoE